MTGITSAPWRESFDFDRFDVRYLKVKDSVEKFAVVQFGICPFKWDSDKEAFITHPHTFYIFPRKELPLDGPAYEFLCQTTSLDFLSKFQFDFNACIYEGISYLSRTQEDKALNRLHLAYEDELPNSEFHSKEGTDIPSVGIADVLFTERMKNKFCEWRDGLLRNTGRESQFKGSSHNSKTQLETVFFNMHPALELNGFTSHQLKLIQLVIRKHFNDLTYIRTNGENASDRKLVVYTDSDTDKNILMKEVRDTKRREAEMKVKTAVGFRHVIDLLLSEQKLVVGHNCFLDIAHIHSKFLGPLPSKIEEFASSIHKHFPHIIDTKYLLKTNKVMQFMMKKKSTSLSKAFAVLCPQFSPLSGSSENNRPSVEFEVQVDELRSSNWNSGAKHEAGYDAFMTGCVFAQACNHLGINFRLQSPSTGLAYDERLQKYINLLYVSWINGSIIDLSTGEETPGSSVHENFKQRYPKVIFENIAVFWGFSSNLKPIILKESLSKVFGIGSVTSIYYLDKTAAFIQFSKKELVSDFLALKETLEDNNDAVSILHPLQKILEDGDTQAADYEVYKQICSSSISRVLFADQAKEVDIRRNIKEEELRVNTESQAEGLIVGQKYSTAKNEIGCSETTKDSSSPHFSCVELMEALCGPDPLPGKRTKASNL
ncbi:Poly(A)-specific ribonuclease PARN [Thalictrum thalictroides]|uniref:Poly(A)-specific ribonuclease PARN n=1 Tax=Thalictrum thalictroides TaxID=46969 RepID=A0A7J6WNI1_THATH|nr:Poly(A)-specific ribonuclease PARN [Thalictrum thalictroides]